MMAKWLGILAQTPYHNRLEGLRGAFNERPSSSSSDTSGAFILIGAAIAIFVLWLILQRANESRQERTRTVRAGKIFNRLLVKFGLSWADRCLLKMLARESGLARPAIIFFDEYLFDQQTQKWIDSISLGFFKRRAIASIERIRERAFVEEGTGELEAA